MKRREFITVLGGAAAWPFAARAQQPAMPVIGFLSSGSLGPLVELVAAFRQGLGQVGYVEGQNVAIEYRFAEGRYERLPALTADLTRRQVAVVVSVGGTVVARAAKASTTTIPIVFLIGDDPVAAGLVASFNRPEGNITGISGLIGGPDRFIQIRRAPIIAAAARHSIPAIYSYAVHVREGGLLSYGTDYSDEFRRAAPYVDRILRGAKPADLPVQLPVKYVMMLNLKTAKALGIEVPLFFQQRADEVIE